MRILSHRPHDERSTSGLQMEMLPRALPGGYWSRRCAPPPSLYRAPPWHRAGQIAPFTGRRRAFRRSRSGNEEEKRGELDGSGSIINHQLKYTFDVQIVVVVKIDITCLYHIHENWSRLRIIILWQNWKHHEHSSWCNPTYSPLSPSSSVQCHNIGLESVLLGPIWHLTAPTSNIHQLKIPHILFVDNEYILCAFIQFKIPNIEY